MAPLVLLHLLSAAPTVSLSADSSCAPREVLRQELGAVFADDGAVVLHLEKDGKLTLEKEGRVVLSRSLGNGTCEELGRAAAVVVSRWVQELLHPVAPVKIELKPAPKPPPSPQPAAAPEPAPTPTPTVSLSPAGERVGERAYEEIPPIEEGVDAGVAPVVEVVASVDAGLPLTPTLSPAGEREKEREREMHFEALGGGGLTAPGAPEVAPVISLDLAMLFIDHLRVDLAGLFDFGGSTGVFDEAGLTRGRLTTRGGAILPGAAWCLTQPLRVCLGATAGLRIIEGEASGTFVFDRKTSRLTRFVFGPNLQLAIVPGPFFLALDASLLITPTPLTFAVEGLPTQLTFPVVQWLFRLSIGFQTSL